MAGSSIKVSKAAKVKVVADTSDVPAGGRASKATASKAWESLKKTTRRKLSPRRTPAKTATSSKRKPQFDQEDAPPKKTKRASLLAVISRPSVKERRRVVPNLEGSSDSEHDMPLRVSSRAPPADKGKGKAIPPKDESSAGSSDEFQPELDDDDDDEEEEDEDEDNDEAENDDEGLALDDIVNLDEDERVKRKQARKAARDRTIKKAIAEGVFEARWPEDKENIPPATVSRSRRHSMANSVASSMPDLEVITSDDEDDDDANNNSAEPVISPPARPSHSSLPIHPAATSAAAPSTISPRNIEFVMPPPGRRFLSLRAQPLPIQEVFERALDYLAVAIYTDDAFPDRRTRADMKLGALLRALRDLKATHHDIETRIWNDDNYMRTFTSLLEPRIPLLRAVVHDMSDRAVLDEYRLPSKPVDRAKALFRLTAACNLIYPLGTNGNPDRSRPFHHPAILSTLHKKFLSGTPNFLETHSRELDIAASEDDAAPVRVPAPLIAFVAVAVYASLVEWRNGSHSPIEFSRDNFNHTYRQFMKRLEDIRERFGLDVYNQYLTDFYLNAMAMGADDDASIDDDDWDSSLVAVRLAGGHDDDDAFVEGGSAGDGDDGHGGPGTACV